MSMCSFSRTGDDAFDRPLAAGDHDALPGQDLLVERADLGEGEQAVAVDVRDRDPDLVDVPEDRERRALRPAATRAKELPRVSPCTSANLAAASRQTAAAGSSCPDGPAAVRRSWRSAGIGTACGLNQARLSWVAMTPSPHGSWWLWRASGAGACV